MTENDVIKSAAKKGLCKPWVTKLKKDNSLKNLCAKFFEGSDWAMENDFPTLEMLREFPTDEFGLHTDYSGDKIVINSIQKQLAFFGKSVAEINISGYSVGEFYVRHDSKLTITADDNAYLVINLMDNASVVVNCKGNSKAEIYRYGENSKFLITGRVNVKDSSFKK